MPHIVLARVYPCILIPSILPFHAYHSYPFATNLAGRLRIVLQLLDVLLLLLLGSYDLGMLVFECRGAASRSGVCFCD